MNKKFLGFQIVITTFIIGLSFSTVLAGEEPPWGTPWKDTNKNIYTLIQEGFRITGTSFSAIPGLGTMGGFLEITYLQKEKELYRCLTIQAPKEESHGCEILISPKKRR